MDFLGGREKGGGSCIYGLRAEESLFILLFIELFVYLSIIYLFFLLLLQKFYCKGQEDFVL